MDQSATQIVLVYNKEICVWSDFNTFLHIFNSVIIILKA